MIHNMGTETTLLTHCPRAWSKIYRFCDYDSKIDVIPIAEPNNHILTSFLSRKLIVSSFVIWFNSVLDSGEGRSEIILISVVSRLRLLTAFAAAYDTKRDIAILALDILKPPNTISISFVPGRGTQNRP